MDQGSQSSVGVGEEEESEEEEFTRARILPEDLPKSLDDRRQTSHNLATETEMYDAWQGMFQATNLLEESLAHLLNRAVSISYKSNACPTFSF